MFCALISLGSFLNCCANSLLLYLLLIWIVLWITLGPFLLVTILALVIYTYLSNNCAMLPFPPLSSSSYNQQLIIWHLTNLLVRAYMVLTYFAIVRAPCLIVCFYCLTPACSLGFLPLGVIPTLYLCINKKAPI